MLLMNWKELLNYNLIQSDSLQLSVYKVMMAVIIVLATILILRIVRRMFKRLVTLGRLDAAGYWSVYQIVRYLVWVIVTILILDTAGIEVSVLLASMAALLIGVGFGIQYIFGDIVSGIVILFEKNIKIGDVLELDDHTVGKVLEIGLRTSKIITRDDIIMIIPNSKFVNDRIINWSNMDSKTRFSVGVGVAYGSDVQLVSRLLLEAARENARIADNPPPFVRFQDFGESSLDFKVYFWVVDSFLVENIKSDLRFAIDRKFRDSQVVVPFPQRDVHIKSRPSD